MASDLTIALTVAESGLRAQSLRMRVISENIANQHSIATTPGGDPYRRRVVSFGSTVDRKTGATSVDAGRIIPDKSDFNRKYDPSNPTAGPDGYVLTPNVNSLIETADMRQAQRAYEANVATIEATRQMIGRTLELLK